MENQNAENQNLIRGVSYDSEPEKDYLILIEGENLENEREESKKFRDWVFVTGRQSAYDYIKNLIKSQYAIVDTIKSKIIVNSEKVKISDGISIYEFMKLMKENDKVIDYESFDIDDYYTGDIEGAE